MIDNPTLINNNFIELNAKEEFKLINKAQNKTLPLVLGQTYYILSSKWFNQWKTYTEKDGPKPGFIENKNLLINPQSSIKIFQLKENQCENEDYIILSKSEWKLLCSW